MFTYLFIDTYRRHLIHRLRHTKQAAFAKSTVTNLRTQWKAYLSFTVMARINPLPITVKKMCLFAQHLSLRVRSPATVVNYLSGLRSVMQLAGSSAPSIAEPQIKLTIRGLKRTMHHKVRRALPMDPQLLKKIHSLLDHNNSFHAVFWLYCVLSFLLFCRKSNLIPNSARAFNPNKQLLWSDISFSSQAVVVDIKWSKTNQFGDKQVTVPLLANPKSELCPVSAIRQVISLVPPIKTHSPFIFKTGTSHQLLTYPLMQSTLRVILAILGKDPTKYSSHSFRRGGATFAHVIGMKGQDIQILGGWASECYKLYLHSTVQGRVKLAKRIRDAI